MRITPTVFVIVIAGAVALATAQSAAPRGLQFGASGGIALPLGARSSYYKPGYFAEILGAYELPGRFDLGLCAGYAGLPMSSGPRIDAGRLEAGLGWSLPLGKVLALQARVQGGGYYGSISETSGFDDISVTEAAGGCAMGDLSVKFTGIKRLELELGARYRSLFGLWDGIEASATARVVLGPIAKRQRGGTEMRIQPLSSVGLTMDAPVFGNIFPVFFKYYNDHSLGTATLVNGEKGEVTDVTVTIFMKQYMDSPKTCAAVASLKPGETVSVPFYALFTDRILEVTEGTMVAADIGLSYETGGRHVEASGSQAVRILDRNAMSWIDDRCAAAYVTAKDPTVLSFSKNVVGAIKDELKSSMNKNFQTAMALHEALDLYGLNYIVDPKSSYSSNSGNKEVVDFLQFPRQTLDYRAGDCDDLSILYSAILESVGIETAFVTVPGHIYLAFSLDASPAEARRGFSQMDTLIEREGKVWLPVEITMRKEGFLEAWQTGAREWREAAQAGFGGFYPTSEAWTVFEPVGLPGAPLAITPPEAGAVAALYRAEISKFVEREVFQQARQLIAAVEESGGAPKQVNALGVLYARYGLLEKAEAEFAKAIAGQEYVPALVNLGNISYLRKDGATAREFYERAYQQDPRNSQAVLTLAKLSHDSERYDDTAKYYASLKEIDPKLADKYAFLEMKGEAGSRAADVMKQKEMVEWSD
jgi:hypothetical protein